jgi:hypothetical protein
VSSRSATSDAARRRDHPVPPPASESGRDPSGLGRSLALKARRGPARRPKGSCIWSAKFHISLSQRYEGKKEAMNIKDTNADRDLEALRAAIAGQVFVLGQAGYDQARQAWNLAVPGPRAVRRGPVLPDPARRGGPARLARMDGNGPGRCHLHLPHPAATATARTPRTVARPGLRHPRGCLPRRRGHRC